MGLLAAFGEESVPTPTALPADPASPAGRRARAELRESLSVRRRFEPARAVLCGVDAAQ